MSLSDASNVASMGLLAMNPTPLGLAGVGLGMARSIFGGKGGGKKFTARGDFNSGYTINGKPVDTSAYRVSGANADYNLLPAIGAGNSVYNGINSPYIAMQNAMANDPRALQQLKAQAFQPRTNIPNPMASIKGAAWDKLDKMQSDVASGKAYAGVAANIFDPFKNATYARSIDPYLNNQSAIAMLARYADGKSQPIANSRPQKLATALATSAPSYITPQQAMAQGK